jgi:hypothetical protein
MWHDSLSPWRRGEAQTYEHNLYGARVGQFEGRSRNADLSVRIDLDTTICIPGWRHHRRDLLVLISIIG